jgi:hypothetical protein
MNAESDGLESRPWTPEAAMEPVPPLAPPPARPGAGTPVLTIPRAPDRRRLVWAFVRAVAVTVVIAALVVLVLTFGH